jgi:UPF0755 protein
MAYKHPSTKQRRSRLKSWPFVMALIIMALLIASVVSAQMYYLSQLRPVSKSTVAQIVTINSGSSLNDIATMLQKEQLIRSSWAMQWYVHVKNLSSSLQAGTYSFTPSDGTTKIVTILTHGKVDSRLITILPGQTIAQIRAAFINNGFSPASVDAALQLDQYNDIPLMKFVPAGVTTLEGMMWPDSYQHTANTDASIIVREAIQAMSDEITPQVQTAFAAEGLTPYQGITLTSIVTKEVSKPTDQTQVAQVFLLRLKQGMKLGSDVTALYGAGVAGYGTDLTYDSPYNTLIHTGLPPTPISTITKNALAATTSPAATTWLYFVTGDDGTTYFSHTFEEHQALAAQYCHKLCGQ